MTIIPCPHCPDGHTPPTDGSQPWAVWIADTEDGDGQPTTLMVARTGGAHVAESDAEWMRIRLNSDTHTNLTEDRTRDVSAAVSNLRHMAVEDER